MLDDRVRALLQAPNFIHLATVMADGAPHSTPVWCGFYEDRPCFFTANAQSLKARNVANDARVAISVVDRENPYKSGQLRGRVAEVVSGDAALEVIDQMAVKHTGAPFPMRSGQIYVIDVERSRYTELPFSER
jgi:PPOX class probable F420-dependent enzyme